MSIWGISHPPIKLAMHHNLWNVVDLIFPPHCAGCNQLGDRWCSVCAESVTMLPIKICPHCNKNIDHDHNCAITKYLDQLHAFAIYEAPLSSAIQQLKYKQNIGIAEKLAFYIFVLYNINKVEVDMVIPVPLSEQRLKSRGFNQASLIAKPFSLAIKRPNSLQALSRTKETRSQVGLNKSERLKNVFGAFKADPAPVKEKNIILIDDVLTTGATMQASAFALKEAGARSIIGLTVAQALHTTFDLDKKF